jgi:hypothetical protein
MKKLALIMVGYLLLLQGCTIGGDKSTSTSEQVTPQPPEASQTQPAGSQAPAQPDETPEPDTLASSENILGLLPSTNPQQRKQETLTGRKDPFGLIDVKPSVKYRPPIVPDGQTPSASAPSADGEPPKVTLAQDNSGEGIYCSRSFEGGSVYSRSAELRPNEARAVLVSGILNLEGQNFAIIKSPEYNYSYRVTEGNFISNGQVLVKNINFFASPPFVILEQYGQEVRRGVGESAEQLPEAQESQDSDVTIVIPKGPEAYGLIRELMITKVDIKGENLSGEACNESNRVITVSNIILQIEDAATGSGLDSIDVDLGKHGLVLKPGQRGEFGPILIELRDRLKGNINVKLRSWS